MYSLPPDTIRGLSYGQVQAYIDRVSKMQEMQKNTIASGLMPMIASMYAR